MSFKLEKELSKKDILEIYINTNYYGNGYYGILDATIGYFDKYPSELSLQEATLLAGIPNAPSAYAPTKHPELAKQRQVQVVNAMIKYGYLDEALRANALAIEL